MLSKSIPQGKPDLQITFTYEEALHIYRYLMRVRASYYIPNTKELTTPALHLRNFLEGHVQNDL